MWHAIVYKELQAMFSEALGEHVYLWAELYTSSRRDQYIPSVSDEDDHVCLADVLLLCFY